MFISKIINYLTELIDSTNAHQTPTISTTKNVKNNSVMDSLLHKLLVLTK